MESKTIGINLKVTGQNELANALRGIGQAINAIDFDKISEVAGVGAIISNLQNKSFSFDVRTGTGISKAIKETRDLLSQMYKINELRNEMYKGGNESFKYFERISQTAVSVPKGMTSERLYEKIAKVESEINAGPKSGITHEGMEKLEILRDLLIDAKKFIDAGNTKGKFINEDVRKWVSAFKNTDAYIRDAINDSIDKYRGLKGMIGESIDDAFKALSQETRDQLIIAFDKAIEKNRTKISDLQVEARNIAKGEDTERNQRRLNAIEKEIGEYRKANEELKSQRKDFVTARSLLNKEERDSIKAQGAVKNVQAVRAQAIVKQYADNLSSVFEDLKFINNKTSAKQIEEALAKREKDLIDYLLKSKPYLMTEEQRLEYAETTKQKSQDILKYRYLLQMKDNVVTERQFKAMEKGQKIYEIPQSFNIQKLDELQKKLKSASFMTPELDKIYNTLDTLRSIAKEYPAGEKLILSDKEKKSVGIAITEFKELSKKLNAEISRARRLAIDKATAKVWTPESAVSLVKDIAAKSAGLSTEERTSNIELLRKQRDKLLEDIPKIKREITGVNKEADEANLKLLKEKSNQLELIRLTIEGLRKANAEAKKPKPETKPEVDKTKKENIKQEAEEQKKKNKLKKEEVDYDLQLQAIEQKLEIAEGKRIDIVKVYIGLKQVLLRLREIDRMMANGILTDEQASTLIQESQLKIAEALTEEEKEQIELDTQQKLNDSEYLKLHKEDLEVEKKALKAAQTRLNVIAQSNKAHKHSIGSILKDYLSMDKIIARMSFVWTAMFSYGMANNIRSIFQSAYQEAIKLEQSMQRIMSIMTPDEKKSSNLIKNSIVNLSKKYGVEMSALGDAMYEIQSSNFEPEFGKELLEQATKMSVAGISTVEEATKLMISGIKTYNIGITDMTRLSDMFFQMVKYGRTTIGELNNNFSVVANTASLLGFDLREVATSLSIMTNQGIETDQAITALNRLLMNFASGGSEEAKKAAKELGFSMNTTALKAEGLLGLVKKLSGATEDQIVELTGNVRAFKALASVMKDQEQYKFFLDQIKNSSGATAKALEEIEGSASFKLNKIKKELTATLLKTMEQMIPFFVALKGVISGLLGIVSAFNGKAILMAAGFSLIFKVGAPLKKNIIDIYSQLSFMSIKTDAATKRALALRSGWEGLAKTLGSSLPYIAIAALSSIVAGLWQAAENAEKLKKELDEIKNINAEGEKLTKQYSEDSEERFRLIKVNLSLLEQYKNKVIDTNRSDAERNVFLDNMVIIMRKLKNEYPQLFDYLNTEGLTIDNVGKMWGNMANKIQASRLELAEFQKYSLLSAKASGANELVSRTSANVVTTRTDMLSAAKQVTFKTGLFNGNTTVSDVNLYENFFDLLRSAGLTSANLKTSYKLTNDQLKVLQKHYPTIKARWLDYALFEYMRERTTIDDNIDTSDVKVKNTKELFEAAAKYYANLEAIPEAEKYQQEALAKLYDFEAKNPQTMIDYNDIWTGWGGLKPGSGEPKGTTQPNPFDNLYSSLKDRWDRGKIENEQALLDEYKKIREYIKDNPEKAQKQDEDFIQWFYNWKKEGFNKRIKVLQNQLKRENTLAGQELIKRDIQKLMNEMNIAFTQYYDFDINDKSFVNEAKLMFKNNEVYIRDKFSTTLDELKKMFLENSISDKAIIESKEYQDLKTLLTKEAMLPTNQIVTGALRLWLKYQEDSTNTVTTTISESDLKEFLTDKEIAYIKEVYSEGLDIRLGHIDSFRNEVVKKRQEYDNKVTEAWNSLLELYNNNYQPTEKDMLLENIQSGKYLQDIEFFQATAEAIKTDIERFNDEYSGEKFKPEIVNEFIQSVNKKIGFIDAMDSGKKLEEMNIDEILKFLEIPNLPSDVVALINKRKEVFDKQFSAIEQERRRREIKMLEEKRKAYEKNKKMYQGFRIFNPVNWFNMTMDMFFPNEDAIDKKYAKEQYNYNKTLLERNKKTREGTYIEGDNNWLQLSSEQEQTIQQEMADYEKTQYENRAETLSMFVGKLKDMWNMYYDWQMKKIQEWYEKQIKVIDNKQKYEYRSALWAEKEKEKIDKEREKKERKLAMVKRAIAIAEVIWNTAAGIMRLYKDFWWPVATFLSLILGGIGAAQVSMINQQKFAKGGKVYGNSHSTGGVPIEVEGGEFIVNKKAAQGNEHILYAVQQMLQNGKSYYGQSTMERKLNELIVAVKRIDIVAEFKGQVLSDVDVWKKTVKGQRLAKVL